MYTSFALLTRFHYYVPAIQLTDWNYWWNQISTIEPNTSSMEESGIVLPPKVVVSLFDGMYLELWQTCTRLASVLKTWRTLVWKRSEQSDRRSATYEENPSSWVLFDKIHRGVLDLCRDIDPCRKLSFDVRLSENLKRFSALRKYLATVLLFKIALIESVCLNHMLIWV